MSGGLGAGLVRLIASLLGLHLQHAQREAAHDLERLVGGFLVLLVGLALGLFALLFAHVALIEHLASALHYGRVPALLLVAAGDLVLSVPLYVVGRLRLRKPILTETRELVRQTVASLSEG